MEVIPIFTLECDWSDSSSDFSVIVNTEKLDNISVSFVYHFVLFLEVNLI
jgi:hypothetical protein